MPRLKGSADLLEDRRKIQKRAALLDSYTPFEPAQLNLVHPGFSSPSGLRHPKFYLFPSAKTPTNSVSGSLAGSCQRTNARRQFVIEWHTLEYSQAAAEFVSRRLRP
jgi:hypothetical protein